MIDILIQIPGPIFLVLFLILSAIGILIAWFWNDDSINRPMPSLTALNPYEIAALRDGRKGVILTALFNLWRRELLTGTKRRIHRNESSTKQPEGAIEEMLYQFAMPMPSEFTDTRLRSYLNINQLVTRVHLYFSMRKPSDFFTNTQLRSDLDKQMVPINNTLTRMHLKRTESQKKRIWMAFWVTLFFILGLGGLKLYFGITNGHPVGFLILLLIILPIILWKVLKPTHQNTQLGLRYQERLNQHFAWMISENNVDSINFVFGVAILGISALDGFTAFASFEEAFSGTAEPDTDNNNNNDGGGGGGGCGGGCGGG
jgi:hypothetical protein